MIKLKLIEPQKLPKEEEYLWRYSDVHRFLNLIKSKQFRFSRMDQFEDPLEGVPYEYLEQFILRNSIPDLNLANVILHHEKVLQLSKLPIFGRLDKILNIQATHFISCWFYEQRESLAMWNLYSNEDGVAIKVPFSKLKLMLLPQIEEERIRDFYCGRVKYQDFRNENPYSTNNLQKIGKVSLRKDVSFSHEKEIRFVVKVRESIEGKIGINSKEINLGDLALKVVCHPRMKNWKKHNIRQILEDSNLVNSYEESEIILRY